MAYSKISSEFDKHTEELDREWEVMMDVAVLKQIFKPYLDDPDLIMVYSIDKAQADNLLKYQNFEFDFDCYTYEIGTFQ